MKLLRWTRFLAAACVLFALGDVAAGAGPSAPGHCGGVTAADAAAILHIPQTDVRGPRITKDVELEAAYNCWYRDSKNFFKSVNFDLSIEKSAEAAERNMDVERENFSGGGAAVAAMKLGDGAWRYTWRGYGPAPRLLMRKGNVWLDVHQPEDQASQIKIAQIVLQHIR